MALFPAFAGATSNKVEEPPKELQWLANKSFCPEDAYSLHQRALEKTGEYEKDDSSIGRELSSDEEDRGGKDDVPPKKKKKKKDKKKKKKHRRSSGSESDTIYPSDLRKKPDSPQPAQIANRFSWLDDLQSPTEQPFCMDRKPDPANWTYKSLYRGDIARYRRKGSSSLGLDPRFQGVTWEESDPNKKPKGRNKKGTADRYFSSVYRQQLKTEPTLPTLPRIPEGSDVTTSHPSFLSLLSEEAEDSAEMNKRGQTSLVNPLGIYDSSTALWLQGKGMQEATGSLKQETQAQQEEQRVAPLVGKTEEFNRRLREEPQNTQLWIDFIRYQDESAAVFGGDQEQQESSDRRRSSYRAVLEKKLSIAERAVATNPSCVALQMERLRLCQELWEPSALAKEWKKLVFVHPNSAPLWREYLLFTQSHFSNFTVSKVNSAYGKCLSTLSAVQDGSMVSHPALPGMEEDMLDIVIQQCHFLRQCGQSEKAISLFQALLDFTFYKPDSVRALTTKQQVEFFEPFWDSGEARVGEAGARGWKAWMLQQERGGWLQPSTDEEDEDEDEDEEEVKDRSQPRGAIWLDVEASREAAHWLPWRPDKTKGQSEEDCEDPDSQVLFDDIGPSLIRLSSPELQLQLLLSFMSFVGVPVDSVLSGAPCQPSLLLENLSLLTQCNDLQRPLTSYDLSDSGVNSIGHMTTLQGTRKWAGLGKQGEGFITSVYHLLHPLLPAGHRAALSLSWMRYEKLKVMRCLRSGAKKRLRSQGKSSKRVAKRLLKEPDNRSSYELWQEYAHLEWLLGNLDDARKVFATATGMGGAKGLINPAFCELCLLWAQLEMEDGAREGAKEAGHAGLTDMTTAPAVCVLTRLAEGTFSSTQALSPVSIVKARRSYDQALLASLTALDKDLQNSQGDRKGERLRVRGLVGCYALFQYLTVGVQAANGVYSQARERMEELHCTLTQDFDENLREKTALASTNANTDTANSRSASRHYTNSLAWEGEVLAVQQVALLRYHTSTVVFPLATLRQTLTSALSAWPSSAPLWSIYIQVENRYHSAGRARRFFHSVMRGNSSVVPRLFAIIAEQHRKKLVDSAQSSGSADVALPILPENGLSNRIRGLFESAIATGTGAHCPLVWRMYMHFLASEGMVDKARGIFYKALQNIPWAKGLYMDAVQLFPEHMQEFVDLMTEKELRVRLPLEELDILLED